MHRSGVMKQQRMIVPLVIAAVLMAAMSGSALADWRDDRRLSADVDRNPAVRIRGNVEVRTADGSLSDSALDEFAALAEKGARDVARFTSFSPPPHIVIYLSPRVDISHTYPHFPSGDHAPRLFIDSARVADHSAPYLHELVHAVVGGGGSMWLEEGFASWVASSVAKQYGGYYAPVLSNMNDQVDAQAREVLARTSAGSETSAWFASASAPDFATQRERRGFYIAAHSFTKFLAASLGKRKLLRIFRANDIHSLPGISGVSIDEWERRWRRSLRAEETRTGVNRP
ncbi:MAG: hypothetical protein QOC81_977 [Thermoanaerobaculia bacterium]|jgi:hypothetical protein|nr:hypothetical protein [Thermoanaerobaculia bacterium]